MTPGETPGETPGGKPAAKPGTWVDGVVAAVLALAALVYGWTLPDELRTLFTAGLAVLLFATLAVVLLSRARIERWSVRRAVRWVVWAAAGALVALALYFVAQATLLRSYRYPAGAAPATVLVPRHLATGPLRAEVLLDDCRDALGAERGAPVRRVAQSADQVAELLAAHGPWNIRLPQDAAWFAWALLLFALYGAAAALLVALFGVLAMRKITPKRLAEEFGTG